MLIAALKALRYPKAIRRWARGARQRRAETKKLQPSRL